MPSFSVFQFTILLGPLRVSAEFLLLSTGPLLYLILLLVVRSKKKSPPIGITLPIGGIVVYLYMLQNREQLEQGTRCEITHFLRSFGSLIHFNFSVIFDFKSCDKNSISLISKATAFMGDLYPLIRILLGPII